MGSIEDHFAVFSSYPVVITPEEKMRSDLDTRFRLDEGEAAIETEARYMLRRTLAIWKPRETIEETLAFCRRTGVGEIIWKVDVDSFNHGFTPIELIQTYLPWLEEARDRSGKAGILFSINPWVSRGHRNSRRHTDLPEGFRWHIRADGAEAPERACPLAQGWRQWLIEAYRLYATTKPDKLWVEDDFRTYTSENVYEIGCFCDAHLEAFAERAGSLLNREELAERLVRPGKPDPIRAQWFDFQGEIMVEICRQLERAVHGESPTTRLGQMNSWSTDGRWWRDSILALSGDQRPLARPSLGPYTDGRTTRFFSDADTDFLKELTCLPEGTEICPELENYPYTPYAKSMRMTRLQLAYSQILGNRAITMNLFDYLGSDTATDPRVERMLAETKPLLDQIAAMDWPGAKPRGVAILFPVRYADSVQVDQGRSFDAFAFDGEGWGLPLQGSGIPVVYNGDGPVAAMTGQSVRALPRKMVEQLLRRGLLLDGSAAAALQELGFGVQLGVEVGKQLRRSEILLGAERVDWFTEKTLDSPVYMPLEFTCNPQSNRVHVLKPGDTALVVSQLVDPDRRPIMSGMTLFENDWGGRVAVYPFDLSAGIGNDYMNWHRKRQIQSVVRWLGRDRVELQVDSGGAWMAPVRKDYGNDSMVALFNFEHDAWDDVSFMLDWRGKAEDVQFERLMSSGRFEKAQPTVLEKCAWNVRLRFEPGVPALDFAVFRIRGNKNTKTQVE